MPDPMMRVRLWVRADDADPKAVARDAATPPGPGALVDVLGARTADDARRVYACSLTLEPDQDQDGEGWLAWTRARRVVVPVVVTQAGRPS